MTGLKSIILKLPSMDSVDSVGAVKLSICLKRLNNFSRSILGWETSEEILSEDILLLEIKKLRKIEKDA